MARAHSMGRSNRGLPSHIVAIHEKNWTPLGIAITKLAAAKNPSVASRAPVTNMWCAQTPKEMNPIAASAATTSR